MIIISLLLASAMSYPSTSPDYAEDKKKYDACVARVKKDYPVPNGNINTQREMIREDCGEPPTPPPPSTPSGFAFSNFALAFDVARSATGNGLTKAAAVADAKSSASSRYGNDITAWGDVTCSTRVVHPNQYDQSVTATMWDCQVDFTTRK